MLLTVQILLTVALALGILNALKDEKWWLPGLILIGTTITFTWIWPFVALIILLSALIIKKTAKLLI
jgi:hypothetical protein